MYDRILTTLSLSILCLATCRAQTVFGEIEPNTSKTQALANGAYVLANGDALTGTTNGSVTAPENSALNTVDTFLVRTAMGPIGIYRHQLTITTTGPTGHRGEIRGLTQTGGVVNPLSDALIQLTATNTAPPRTNVWYGFGKGESLYWRTAGATATTSPYVATLTTTSVMPTDLGIFGPGPLTISHAGLTASNTDIWVYDAGFNAIPGFGNDNPLSGGTQAVFSRVFAPGVYYVAMSPSNLANNLTNPPDSIGSTDVMDFPDVIATSFRPTATLDFRLTDCNGTTLIPAATTSLLEIRWFKITVGGSMTLSVTQPMGPGSAVIIQDSGGLPGNIYFNAITFNAGSFPNGWLFGLDIPYADFAFEASSGAPFIGFLDGTGSATFIFGGFVPPGLTIYCVGIEFSTLSLLPVSSCFAPFSFTTQ